MGCRFSSSAPTMSPQWIYLFHSVGLNDIDVTKFWKIFMRVKYHAKLDTNQPVPIRCLLSFLEVEPVIFIFKVFSAFKPNNEPNGNLDNFGEFLFALWNFCTLDETLLGNFSVIISNLLHDHDVVAKFVLLLYDVTKT